LCISSVEINKRFGAYVVYIAKAKRACGPQEGSRGKPAEIGHKLQQIGFQVHSKFNEEAKRHPDEVKG